jgi:hypothetical protein
MFSSGTTDLHEKSVKAAEFLLVSAVNDGRHVIFDSTMMWAPFVDQTVQMIRASGDAVFECGPGWVGENAPEVYWIKKADRGAEERSARRAYTISIYGIFADPARSVPRCLVRELTSNRTMLVSVLLKSLKLFAQNFAHYCELVDEAVLFDNNVWVDLEKGELPPTAARKDARGAPLEILDASAWQTFLRHRTINVNATHLDALYESATPASTLTSSVVASPQSVTLNAIGFAAASSSPPPPPSIASAVKAQLVKVPAVLPPAR